MFTLDSMLWTMFPWLPVLLAGLYGTFVGSFLNVVIYRTPIMLTRRSGHSSQPFNLAWPPSSCPNCKNHIRARHNIPVLGWISLQGKCFDCRTPISARYPVIEALTGLILALTAWLSQASPQTSVSHAMVLMGLFSALIAIAAIAYDTHSVPVKLSAPLILLGIIFSVLSTGPDDFRLLTNTLAPKDSLIGTALGISIPFATIQVYRSLRKSRPGSRSANLMFAHGEWLLFGVAGAWLGWKSLAAVAFASAILMVGSAAFKATTRYKDDSISDHGKWNMGTWISVSIIAVALHNLVRHTL